MCYYMVGLEAMSDTRMRGSTEWQHCKMGTVSVAIFLVPDVEINLPMNSFSPSNLATSPTGSYSSFANK